MSAFLAISLLLPRAGAAQDVAGSNGGQASSSAPAPPARGLVRDPASGLWRPVTTERTFLRNLGADQLAIWKSPFHLHPHDLSWLVPFGTATAMLISGDQELTKRFPGGSVNSITRSRSISNYGAFALAGSAGGAWIWGRLVHDDHKRETGLLSAEAAIDSLIVNYGIKEMAGRQRPIEGDGNGRFFQGGASFPSEHSMFAWSVASVIGNEYPGPVPKFLAYGLASAVSLTRVSGREHFASDVMVGGVLGWLTGQYVYRTHHDPQLPGAAWGKDRTFDQMGEHKSGSRGTVYVPLDSWIYPAFDRLAAMGALQTDFPQQRPWSQAECQRLLEEAEDLISTNGSLPAEATGILKALEGEFEGAGRAGIGLDSLYVRGTAIKGTPLTDGFHFEQTLYNDLGRPYESGFNGIAGATVHANDGPFFAYLQAEYQHAPGAPGYSQPVNDAIAAADSVLIDPAAPIPAVNRVRLMETYVGTVVGGWQISFGKQSLWWGPTAAGPFLYSTNAEPVLMGRFTREQPYKLPWPLGWLGLVKTDLFFGQLSGQRFIEGVQQQPLEPMPFNPQPFLHGEKITFKPKPNLEFSLTKTTIFGGVGSPLTLKHLLSSYFTVGNCPVGQCKPGDRLIGFDFSYRVRNFLQLYTDAYTEDEPFPVAYASRSAWNPGIYIPRVPKIPKLDLRVEHVFTPTMRDPGFFYNDIAYRSGYTENGALIGSWVGREGRSTLGWLTYWLTPQSTLQLNYRVAKSSAKFLQGGSVNDLGIKADLMLRRDTRLIAKMQYESWNFPLLSTTQHSNLTASVEIVYHPRFLHRRSSSTPAGLTP